MHSDRLSIKAENVETLELWFIARDITVIVLKFHFTRGCGLSSYRLWLVHVCLDT